VSVETAAHTRTLLSLYIVGAYVPFAQVDDPGFRAYNDFVCPGLTLPSARTLKRDIQSLYKESFEKIKRKLAVSITCLFNAAVVNPMFSFHFEY